MSKSQAELSQTTNNQITQTNAQISELASIVKSLVSSSQKTPQGQGGGSSSAPASPVLKSTGEESPNIFHPKPKSIGAALAKINEGIIGEAPEAPEFKDNRTRDFHMDRLVPSQYPEIEALVPTKGTPDLKNGIVVGDLESLITPDGKNLVYMAAWYNGTTHNIFNIGDYGYNTNTMLEQFWIDLINNNLGKNCYFHNFGGYDAILSLPSLLSIPPYKFYPIMKDGEIISIKVTNKGKIVLIIKDSIRILPGALSKLAKDWGATTLKDHFPHYFFLDDVKTTLDYVGKIPAYKYFEPKRTSLKDFEEMKELFSNQVWSFLKVSEKYILGDCKATYEVLIKYFETLVSKFPINPLKVYSAPSAAFRIWRTVQLPLLHQEGPRVFDISQTLDSQLRETYCGGIVDVYRPHLVGKGFYYDVNSLYPTAMCNSMPVGMPQLVNLTVKEFLDTDFYGFIEATVIAPLDEYIGLLPIKIKGRLVCPGGRFIGLFFSEELRFALENGAQLYYSDTDSLVVNGQLPEEVCDPALLGKLKLEYKFKEGIFVMPTLLGYLCR